MSRVRGKLAIAALLSLAFLRPSTSGAGVLTLFDANSKEVGEIISIDPDTADVLVAFKAKGQQPLIIKANFLGFSSFFNNRLLYQSTDTTCSGPPLMQVASEPFAYFVLPPAAIGPPGTTLYVPDPKASTQTITAGSQFTRFGCQSGTFTFTGVVPALAVTDLNTLFTPPFTVKAK